MKKILSKIAMITIVLTLFACAGGDTDVVESGVYQGSVKKVETEKTEIYVEIQDNKTLELYFTENTSLTRNGETVDFSELSSGQRVEVEVEKVGQRLDPISVEILE